ncbi:hypothetical protein ACFPYI_07135 [Halomarina salina]|uniref:Type I restriction enzyme R protein N-terminal domain-containing protein n=1 Tax=Halomarina salina TaxID=1872699 RepID=A0ABD5RKM8_9EURY|nr:hypothetical protein [Halomarina salina]
MDPARLNPDSIRADNLISSLEDFVSLFHREGESKRLDELLQGEEFLGGSVGQAPEDFTEHTLIQPILSQLGYKDSNSCETSADSPRFIRQPVRMTKDERRRPDYRLENVDDRMIAIVESKAINLERPAAGIADASDNIMEYLQENTLCKYLRTQEGRFLVGLGTDGFRWSIYAKDLRGGGSRCVLKSVSLTDEIAEIASRRHGKQTDQRWRPQMRNSLAGKFVSWLSVENLPSHVADNLNQFKYS